MTATRWIPAALAAAVMLWATTEAAAEPMFLAKQYTRCTPCHHSPTGGGLLTPYGRSLSHHELSTTGEPMPSHEQDPNRGEQAFLYGVLGDAPGPVRLGINLRPSYLHYSFLNTSVDRDLLMSADLMGAVKVRDWTFYGEVGREPLNSGSKIDSYEYWAGRQPDEGIGFRVGRFIPAYGVGFSDHTAFNRAYLGLAQYDQIYGLEVSHSRGRYLTQVSIGPGYADGVIKEEDRREGFTATGRFQVDLGPSTVLVGSGLFRDESDVSPRTGSGGAAVGFAPTSRLTVWTQFDTVFQAGASDPSFVFVNQTSFEAFRGVWLQISPQSRTGGGDAVPNLLRLELGAVLLPRTHWNVNLSYYRDRNQSSDITSHIFLAQLHLYL
jgi:hypothetical protein